MAFDTKKWLMEDLGFTAEDAEAVLPKFADRADKLEKGYLRQSDYSKHMNELKTAQTALETANAKLTADMAEWAEMTAAEQAKLPGMQAALEKEQERVFKLTQKVTRLAEESGRDPKELLGDEPIVEKPPPVPAFDPTDLEKTVNQRLGGVADFMLTLNAELPSIAQEHFELTGERLDIRAFVQGIKDDIRKNKTDNLDPVKRWESQFQIPDKRSEKAQKEREQWGEQRFKEGQIAARSEQMLPNTRPVGPGSSPVFRSVAQQGASKLQRPQPTDRMAGARAALASGKYRQGGNSAASG